MISRPTAFAAVLGLSLFSAQGAAANNTYVLGDPCTTIGETHISSDQTAILACLKKDKNQGAVQGNLFWKNAVGAGKAAIECTVGEVTPNPLSVTIRPGGDPNALKGFGDTMWWGGQCLNGYVLTGCTMETTGGIEQLNATLMDGGGNPTTFTYVNIANPSQTEWDMDLEMSDDQSCGSNDAEWRVQNTIDVTCCHVVMK
jgi:hypothetical protein